MRKLAFLVFLVVACTVPFGAAAQTGFAPCEDTVRVQVVGSIIDVYHDQAEWNCCAEMVFELAQVQDTFNLSEFETFDVGPCWCICCFDLATSILHVPPGEYLVRVLNGHTGEPFREVWVTVEMGGSADPSLGETTQSPCGGWTTAVKEETNSTWGRIKVLHR